MISERAAAMLALADAGWTEARIGRLFDVHPDTVAGCVRGLRLRRESEAARELEAERGRRRAVLARARSQLRAALLAFVLLGGACSPEPAAPPPLVAPGPPPSFSDCQTDASRTDCV
jgi:hypothetical protein